METATAPDTITWTLPLEGITATAHRIQNTGKVWVDGIRQTVATMAEAEAAVLAVDPCAAVTARTEHGRAD